MKEQNYKNHSRLLPVYHYLGYLLLLTVVAGSFINLCYCYKHDECLYSPVLICLISFILVILVWYARYFALRAQDRAIRAEENFRHFIATGKPLDSRLRMGQIISLRFAGDDEFVALAKRAVDESLKPKEIKMAIKNWKADNNRV